MIIIAHRLSAVRHAAPHHRDGQGPDRRGGTARRAARSSPTASMPACGRMQAGAADSAAPIGRPSGMKARRPEPRMTVAPAAPHPVHRAARALPRHLRRRLGARATSSPARAPGRRSRLPARRAQPAGDARAPGAAPARPGRSAPCSSSQLAVGDPRRDRHRRGRPGAHRRQRADQDPAAAGSQRGQARAGQGRRPASQAGQVLVELDATQRQSPTGASVREQLAVGRVRGAAHARAYRRRV